MGSKATTGKRGLIIQKEIPLDVAEKISLRFFQVCMYVRFFLDSSFTLTWDPAELSKISGILSKY